MIYNDKKKLEHNVFCMKCVFTTNLSQLINYNNLSVSCCNQHLCASNADLCQWMYPHIHFSIHCKPTCSLATKVTVM